MLFIFLCVAIVPKEVFDMIKQGGFRHLWVHRLSVPSGEMPLSSPGLIAESPEEVSVWYHWIMFHGMGIDGKGEFRTDIVSS